MSSLIGTGLLCVGFFYLIKHQMYFHYFFIHPSLNLAGLGVNKLPICLLFPQCLSKWLTRVFFQRFTLTPSANFLVSLYGEGANLKPENTPQGLTSTSSECITKSSDLQCDPIIQRYGEKKQGLTSYTLTLEEQKRNDYPIEGSPGCKGYISTECDQQRTDSSPLFGLDCEMVKVSVCGLKK